MSKRDRQTILFVDGYNMIGSWPELRQLQRQDEIQAARDLLLFELSNYATYREMEVIVVFDAQHVPGITAVYDQYNIQVVFTKEGETADSYIEREVQEYVHPLNRVIVATSDAAEQWMIFQHGALRQSAQELYIDINYAKSQIEHSASMHYESIQRRRSPWGRHQLKLLDELRRHIEGQDT